jgi:hypothetical protein
MKNMTFLNANAVARPERRTKKREIQTLCMLGLIGFALFMLSGCGPNLSGNSTPRTTLEKSGGGGGY